MLRKSRRIAFLMLSSSRLEDSSLNSFVFKLADRQTDRQTDRQIDRYTTTTTTTTTTTLCYYHYSPQHMYKYTTLHVTTLLNYTTIIALHYINSIATAATTRLQLQLHVQLRLITLHFNYNYTCNYTTLQNVTLITLRYATLHYSTVQLPLRLPPQLHYTTLISLHHNWPHYATTTTSTTATITTTLLYTTLQYTTKQHTTLQYTTLHYTNYTTPQLQLQVQRRLHFTNYTTLQLQPTSLTTIAAVHHTTSSSCGWGDHCNQCNHCKKKQLQPPFGPSGGFALPSMHHNNSPLL